MVHAWLGFDSGSPGSRRVTGGRHVDEWRIKRMKTCWGTCTIRKRRICLQRELARAPEGRPEYIPVHGSPLLERCHIVWLHGQAAARLVACC